MSQIRSLLSARSVMRRNRFLFALELFDCLVKIVAVCVPSANQCGCPVIKPIVTQRRIVGGQTARENSWPWIVSLRQGKKRKSSSDADIPFCAGSLISATQVLTAAHCLSDLHPVYLNNYAVVVGSHYSNDSNAKRFQVKSILFHPDYDENSYLNDIALVELSAAVDLTDPRIGIICLPRTENTSTYPTTDEKGFVAGWGLMHEDREMSWTLQQAEIPIISNANRFCSNYIVDRRLQVCAGLIDGGRDTCQGDSGGPLMIFDKRTETWLLAGITSFGYGCARINFPGIYTRVSSYVTWIENQRTAANSSSVMHSTFISCIFLLLVISTHYFFES